MIGDFIYKYYVGPIVNGEAYTIVDTLTYALILILSVYLVYRWLERTGISIDRDFILAVIPYVVLGGTLRVVEDTGIIPYPWYILLITPVIFFAIFFYAIIVLIISRTLESKGIIRRYTQGFAAGGIIAVIASLIPLVWYGITQSEIHISVMVIILAMAFASSAAVWLVIRYVFKWDFASDILYKLLIFGHLLDASATSFGIDLHEMAYVEQHVVGSALIDATGTAFSMFGLKLVVVIPAIYILEMYRKEGNKALWHLIILAMIMVGMAPGIRDMVRMILYV
ncbi:DUF63 family protein [Methanoplanus limicola]|uniref:DUF63 family protein n=1 Tax=Methanoplanus limicola DSM 2279 TaxID=937775 RepID=H1YWL9_9EURY|nr:DUF63 family protein [Methanoplanus limicola]EHQ35821.1 protein of unknown function DUF63 [Methanoplanus limicola DSM 2279]